MSNAERAFIYPPKQDPENEQLASFEGGEETAKIIEFPSKETVLDLPKENKSMETAQHLHTKILELQGELEKLKYNSSENILKKPEESNEINLKRRGRKAEFNNPSEKIRDILKKENILVQTNGRNIFDVEAFLSDDFQEKIRRKTVVVSVGKYKLVTKTILFDALRELSVVSKKDYLSSIEENKTIQEKPLFNVPDSVEDAFDLEKIRNKEYYLNYWEIFGREGAERRPTWDHDMIAKNGSSINMKELSFATKLFRDFQARREESGKLKVFDEIKQKYVGLKNDWLRENLGGYGNCTQKYNSLHQFLVSNCPNLLQKGLVRLEDFRIITNSSSGNLLRKEFDLKSDAPDIMINGVRYYIGRENFNFEGQTIPKENIKIVVLDQTTAGIILVNGGQEKVIFTFDLLDDEEKNAKREKVKRGSNKELTEGEISARTVLNKKEMNGRVHNWKRTEDNSRLENETPEAYAERMSSIADYGYIKKVTEDFALQGIGIHNLSWREQQWLVSASFELRKDYPKLLEFGKKYGMDGLKTFLSCEYGLEHGKEILRIGEKLSPETATAIFAKYNEIANVAENNIEDLVKNYLEQNETLENKGYKKITESLLKKAKDLLADFSNRISVSNEIDEGGLIAELEKTKTDIVFFTSVFKNFAKNNPEASFEDFKGLSFETVSSPEVRKYSERFFEIADENNKNENPILQGIVRKGLEKGLASEKTVFDVLLRDDQPIALERFDDNGNHYYYGSVNVDPKYRGSAIFEQMKKQGLDRRAKEKPIKAHCNSANFVSSQYVENSGFVIDGTVLDGGVEEKDGRTIDNRLFTFSIERDDQKNGNYQYRQNVSIEQLKAIEKQLREDLESGKESRKELVRNRKPFVVSFEENQRPTFFKLAEKLTKDYGYVISRYFFDGKTGGKFFAGFEQKL